MSTIIDLLYRCVFRCGKLGFSVRMPVFSTAVQNLMVAVLEHTRIAVSQTS
jgi:hypothetical protein